MDSRSISNFHFGCEWMWTKLFLQTGLPKLAIFSPRMLLSSFLKSLISNRISVNQNRVSWLNRLINADDPMTPDLNHPMADKFRHNPDWCLCCIVHCSNCCGVRRCGTHFIPHSIWMMKIRLFDVNKLMKWWCQWLKHYMAKIDAMVVVNVSFDWTFYSWWERQSILKVANATLSTVWKKNRRRRKIFQSVKYGCSLTKTLKNLTNNRTMHVVLRLGRRW